MRVKVRDKLSFYCKTNGALFNSITFYKGRGSLFKTGELTYLVMDQLKLGL